MNILTLEQIKAQCRIDPEKMDIRPEPNEENGTVDIIFNLESKANDQVEFPVRYLRP